MSRDGAVTGVSDTGAWQRIAEALMLGVFHDLGSRASALNGIVRMARMEVSFEDTLLPLLEGEVAKLTRSVELVRLLPRQPQPTPKPLSIGKLIPEALELHRHHPHLERIEYRYEASTAGAVNIDYSTLGHSLLSLFSVLGWTALGDGYPCVEVRAVEEGGWIVVGAELAGTPDPASVREAPDDLPGLTQEVVGAVRLAAEEAGGEVSAETGEGRLTAFELRLPALAGAGG